MGDVNREREAIKNVYPNSQGWADKVDKMPPAQVTAVYIRFSAQGKLGR